MKTVKIRPVLNGFVVTVGCSEVVFECITKLCIELARYHAHPEQVEKEYMNKAVNRRCPGGMREGGIGMTATEAARETMGMPLAPAMGPGPEMALGPGRSTHTT